MTLMIENNDYPMASWLYIYRRKFLVDERLFFAYGRLHEDEQFTPRAILKAKKIVDSNACHYNYVIRDNSITTKKDKRKNASDVIISAKELRNFFDNENINRYIADNLMDSFVNKYLSIFQSGNLKQYYKRVPEIAFLKKNSKLLKTKLKVLLVSISPKLYSIVYKILK